MIFPQKITMQNISAISVTANMVVSAFVELTVENLVLSPFGGDFVFHLSRRKYSSRGCMELSGILTKQIPKVWAGLNPVGFDQPIWSELVRDYR